MRPWDFSIRNPVFITMIMLALVVVGVIAYTSMPLDFFPDVSFPTMAVITVYPGAGPGEIESQVTKPIEEAMVTASGVESVQSRSSEGYSVVIVSFGLDKDVKQRAPGRAREDRQRARRPAGRCARTQHRGVRPVVAAHPGHLGRQPASRGRGAEHPRERDRATCCPCCSASMASPTPL